MPSTAPRDRTSALGTAGFLPVLLANLVPLVGVFRLGWDPATLAAVYAIEVVLSVPLSGAKALFAARPPPTDREAGVISVTEGPLSRKRGAVRPASWLPPIYPRNVPFAASVCGAGVLAALVGGVAFSQTFDVPALLGQPAVLASALALVAGQVVEIARDYVGRRRYADTSPYAVVETPTRRAFFLVFVLFALPALDAAGGGVAVVAAFVAVKLLVEWSGFRATHGDEGSGGGITGWLAGPTDSAEPPAPIAVPDAEPDARIPAHRRAVIATAVLKTLTGVAPVYATGFLIAWIVVLGVFVGGGAGGAVAVGSAVLVLALYLGALAVNAAGFALAHAPIEYRRYGDRLVAYDAWLDEPQWAAAVDSLRDASVVHTRFPDRAFDARTVALTAGVGDDETERFLGPVADGEALVAAFDLPIRSTDLPPMDRRIAAISVGLGVAVAAAGVAWVVGPWSSSANALRILLLLPFLVWPTRVLWRQAYAEPE